MTPRARSLALITCCAMLGVAPATLAQDWPQWLGPNRDAKSTDFTAPETWPQELTQQWAVTVGDGVATPALVGDRVYVFARQGGNEVIRCVDAASGESIWQAEYPAEAVTGAAASFAGPRSSPAVAEGKVVTLGVQGVLSCYDAQSGNLLWRNEEYQRSVPRFATSSSPLIVDGLCIAQLGGGRNGALVALALDTGQMKWKCDTDGPAYASPMLMTSDETQFVLALTERTLVAVRVDNGASLWNVAYAQGRYNAATPIVHHETFISFNDGTRAEKIAAGGEQLAAENVWTNSDVRVQFNTPVWKDGLLFGLSNADSLFCLHAQSGQTAWTAPLQAPGAAPPAEQGRRRGGRGGGGGGGGYGSIVDAGAVLFALSPAGELVAFPPSGDEFRELARYRVSNTRTYAYPVISGNRVFIKDQDSLILWTFD